MSDVPPGFLIEKQEGKNTVMVQGPGIMFLFTQREDAEAFVWNKFEELFGMTKLQWKAIVKAVAAFPDLLSYADKFAENYIDEDKLQRIRDSYISWSSSSSVDDIRRNLRDIP